ncbi:DedA family protein [Planococcus lenghuensis]|uniref:Alkaline phosphatase n=1 Tax=Planococcus lenghuensis TaxID=2213202 RepID=A0A1Q2L2U2_9BACL|nr:DedA family protein [Planococcus lenghuensis]AQQ54387.1 alkaline phosphatase [Planococcus lenghuensis]
MENWITDVMANYGYWGVFLLIMLENVFPPIPSEVILTFGGFMTATTQLTIFGVIVASTAGSVAGAVILYGVGRVMSVPRLERLIDRYGKWLRIDREDLHKANGWFEKYGIWTVFFCRFIPLIRSLISIPAGSSGMHLVPFLIFTTLGTIIWNTVLVWLGASVGENWEEVVGKFDVYSNIMYALLALLLVIGFIWFIRRKKDRT